MPGVDVLRRCVVCKESKPVTEFGKWSQDKDGIRRDCKSCDRAAGKKYRNQAHVRARRRAYQFRYYHERLKGTDKAKARDAVKYAIKIGSIPNPKRLSCTRCGGPAREYHHHRGYSDEYAMDVIPVCKPCHSVLDKEGSHEL